MLALRPAPRLDVDGHHRGHHLQTRAHGHREQPLLHVAGQFGHRDRHRHGHHRHRRARSILLVVLLHSGPLSWVDLAVAQHLPQGRCQAGDRHLNFHETRDNLVEERWGKDAYASSDAWYRGMSEAERGAWKKRSATLGADGIAAAESGIAPDSDEAQALARRHADWLGGIPGTPGHGTGAPAKGYLLGLGDMYVADPRFAVNYGGVGGATFVRDALRVYAERLA